MNDTMYLNHSKTEIGRSYLIQRLKAPYGINGFAFGGGLHNGGLSDEAMELLSAFFFFADKEMWEQTATLFGIKTPSLEVTT